MTIIAPSILACDFTNIQSEISVIESSPETWLHLDIMDGHFVPNLTFGGPVIKRISQITKLPLDAHLMVTNPKFHVDMMKDYGIHNITFHYEAVNDCLELIKYAKQFYPSVGISIKPKTSVSEISQDILEEIDLLLVMSVEPGFGGQGFIEETYEKLDAIKPLKEKYKFQVQVDGGVKNNNSQKLVTHGADNLVAGSYVFNGNQNDYLSNIESLRE